MLQEKGIKKDAVVPRILPAMGLPYKGADAGRVRTSHRGVRLHVPEGCELPLALDRLPILFLAALAAVCSEAAFKLSELCRWVGKRKKKKWRRKQAAKRLRRLLECEIEELGADGTGPYKIAEYGAVDTPRDTVYVRFSEEFRRSARDGVVISQEHIRALSLYPFTLEVYTLLRLILHDGYGPRSGTC